MLVTYEYACCQAHCRLPQHLFETLEKVETLSPPEISEEQLQQLSKFLQTALGDHSGVGREARDTAKTLMSYLQKDLAFNVVDLAVDEGKTDATVTIQMANKSTKDYFSLELWWSVD